MAGESGFAKILLWRNLCLLKVLLHEVLQASMPPDLCALLFQGRNLSNLLRDFQDFSLTKMWDKKAMWYMFPLFVCERLSEEVYTLMLKSQTWDELEASLKLRFPEDEVECRLGKGPEQPTEAASTQGELSGIQRQVGMLEERLTRLEEAGSGKRKAFEGASNGPAGQDEAEMDGAAGRRDNVDDGRNDIQELARVIRQSQREPYPKINVPLFDGNHASSWADKFEQLGYSNEWTDEKMLHMVKGYCQVEYRDEIDELVRISHEKEGIAFTTICGEVFDYKGNLIDPNIEGGMRKEAFRRMGRPLPATFRIASPEEARLAEVEEAMALLHIDDSPTKPEGFREQVVERAQTITRRFARCRDSIIRLCVDMEEVWPGLPNVFLFGEWGDKMEDATGQAGTSALREASQTGPMMERESEKAVEEKPIPVSESDEDNEDEKLQAGEEERARRHALEKESEKGKTEADEEEPRKKKNIYSIPVEQGVDIEQLVDKILESQRNLVTLKEFLVVSPKIREDFKQRMTRKRVMTVKLGEVIPPEANWSLPGTKMDWRSVSTGHIKVQIGQEEYSALVDDGAEMNIIRERHAIEAGLKINRNDYGFLVGASGSTPFCGTVSGVLVTVGKVKVRSYFYVLPRVEHEVRSELVMEEPFIEEEPWGEQTVEEMMRLTLTDDIDLMLDPLTIEQGHIQADDAFQIIGRMSYIMNLLVHEDRLRLMNVEEGSSEVKEAFKEKEYEGEYKKIGMWLNGELDENEVDPVVWEKGKGFVVRNGHLFKKATDGVPKRVVCGTSRQLDVIVALHDGLASGHRSARVTFNKIQRLYFWKGMSKVVIDFCTSCFLCQQRSNIRYPEPLNPRYVAEPGAVAHLDLLVMPPGINGYTYIFDARDNLTGFIDGRAIRERTGSVLTECIEEYYLRYPFVQEIVMDRGGEFRAKEVQTLLKRLG
ncbi:hypothetical protein CBR_g4382 [Chara braunii]|uniref:Integrase catalytic domain-containing protein n=1 Tax=Chara braunii TaxID=69332 RepID=A0A388KHR5_CHABU|nr:hypothetical protein CBR_g4382 [Chara braunii]|eukprot:GBG69548.1 hypothetical protein CBR_g4382 [Chara braunii]